MEDSSSLRRVEADKTPLRAAQAMATGLLHTVRIAAALIEAGRTVDLGGIDDLIGRLCARALDLPPEQGSKVAPDLRRLLTEIDRLHARLAGRADPPSLLM